MPATSAGMTSQNLTPSVFPSERRAGAARHARQPGEKYLCGSKYRLLPQQLWAAIWRQQL
jgi:hypothetical protein